jgi:hypothetical protein
LMIQNIVEREMAFTFGRSPLADGQKPAQTAVGGAIGGIYKQGNAVSVGQFQSASNGQWDTDLFRSDVSADDPGQRVAIGDGDAGVSVCRRLLHEFIGMTCPAEEREVAGDLKFSVRPWRRDESQRWMVRRLGRSILRVWSCFRKGWLGHWVIVSAPSGPLPVEMPAASLVEAVHPPPASGVILNLEIVARQQCGVAVSPPRQRNALGADATNDVT